MRKQLVKNILTMGIISILFISNTSTVLAYTQDECGEAWDELNKKYGINSEDYYGGGRASRTHIL